MSRPNQPERFWSSVAQTLAALALFVMVLVPQGTMLARSGDQVFITICSGHGPMTVQAPDDLGGKKTPADKKAPDAPCPFAGHAPSVPVPTAERLPAPLPSPIFDAASNPASKPAPGRGLVAPPPPSRGPPTLSI
jgi:hypothetical protein